MTACGRSATVESGGRWPVADLYLSLLGDLRRIVHLDPEIPDGALKVGISEEK
jgi:hypothetical protein